jgi:hypothetical protein
MTLRETVVHIVCDATECRYPNCMNPDLSSARACHRDEKKADAAIAAVLASALERIASGSHQSEGFKLGVKHCEEILRRIGRGE